ncbi:hypothetical protein, partial [Angustibacter peucedani]
MTAQGEPTQQQSSYRGRRRREADVEVTEPVTLADLAERSPQVPPAAPQYRTRAEAEAAARTAEAAARTTTTA